MVIPKNGSENEISEMVKDPVGNSIFEPAPFKESSAMQNKISE